MTDLRDKESIAEATPEVAGILAEFDGPEALKAAARALRDQGFEQWDVHSPFPIHGMERSMGVRPTLLPWLVLGAGVAGAGGALLLQWWTNAIDFPMVISGKPYFSLPANIPIIFELLVLLSAFAAFGGALVLNNLPKFWHWTFSSRRFESVTSDGFFISIDAADQKFDEAAVRALMQTMGARAIEICLQSEEEPKMPAALYWISAVVIVLAVLPWVLVMKYRAAPKSLPRFNIFSDMDFQEKYKTQGAGKYFADGRAMRLPVPGTVAEDGLQLDDHFYRGLVDGQPATTFPMPVTKAMMERGQQRFNIYCSPCHGLLGEGGNTGIISIRALKREEPGWVPPLSLHKPEVRAQSVGQYFSTITNGIRKMPSYGERIPVEDRWAIILYVRALQRSQNATLEDVPEDIRSQLR